MNENEAATEKLKKVKLKKMKESKNVSNRFGNIGL